MSSKKDVLGSPPKDLDHRTLFREIEGIKARIAEIARQISAIRLALPHDLKRYADKSYLTSEELEFKLRANLSPSPPWASVGRRAQLTLTQEQALSELKRLRKEERVRKQELEEKRILLALCPSPSEAKRLDLEQNHPLLLKIPTLHLKRATGRALRSSSGHSVRRLPRRPYLRSNLKANSTRMTTAGRNSASLSLTLRPAGET